MKAANFIFGFFIFMTSMVAFGQKSEVESLKGDIISLAETFQGLGDADFSKQHALDSLVEKLLRIAPQPPVKKRLPLIAGVWKQVWGPYDYRKEPSLCSGKLAWRVGC